MDTPDLLGHVTGVSDLPGKGASKKKKNIAIVQNLATSAETFDSNILL